MSPDMLSDRFHRRDFLLASAAGAAAVALPATMRSTRGARHFDDNARPTRRARNCIFMVSDGMSTGTLSLANLWSRRREGRDGRWVGLWSLPGVWRSAQQ